MSSIANALEFVLNPRASAVASTDGREGKARNAGIRNASASYKGLAWRTCGESYLAVLSLDIWIAHTEALGIAVSSVGAGFDELLMDGAQVAARGTPRLIALTCTRVVLKQKLAH